VTTPPSPCRFASRYASRRGKHRQCESIVDRMCDDGRRKVASIVDIHPSQHNSQRKEGSELVGGEVRPRKEGRT
jgi:hypothetical protein